MESTTKHYNVSAQKHASLFRNKYEGFEIVASDNSKEGVVILSYVGTPDSPIISIYRARRPHLAITGTTDKIIREVTSVLEKVTGVSLIEVKK